MKTSSCKNKARVLQQAVATKILEKYEDLHVNDVRSTPMGVSGVDIQLSEAAASLFPYSVECKNQEKISIWKELQQTESDTKERDLIPLLVFKRNRSKVYCALEFETFLKLIK